MIEFDSNRFNFTTIYQNKANIFQRVGTFQFKKVDTVPVLLCTGTGHVSFQMMGFLPSAIVL